jgi:hypothetical protein
MKSLTFLFVVLIFAVFTACNKTSDECPAPEIVVSQIGKTVTVSHPDSISGTCKAVVFVVKQIDNLKTSAFIMETPYVISCDGYNQVIVNNNGNVAVLKENQKIDDTSEWKDITKISLCDLAGKGECYIGLRDVFYPGGVDNYKYRWLKIELSEKEDTLKIISSGTNQTENCCIKTGQME